MYLDYQVNNRLIGDGRAVSRPISDVESDQGGSKLVRYTNDNWLEGGDFISESVCCLCLGKEDFTELCISLFNLQASNSEDSRQSQFSVEELYFAKYPKQQLKDMMEQFAVMDSIKHKGKQQEFKNWIDEEFNKLTMIKTTHQDVYDLLMRAKYRDFIDIEQLSQMLKFRKEVIDLFCLVDKDHVKTLYKCNGELDEFWQIMDDVNSNIEKLKAPEVAQKYRVWYEKGQEQLIKVTFHEFQKFLWEGKVFHEQSIEELQKKMFKQRVGFCKFLCFFKYIRSCIIKKRLKPKDAKLIHYSWSKVVKNFLIQCLHTFDLYTDIALAGKMYWLSRSDEQNNQGQSFNYDYNICFVIISMAIFGPYIIQYSSMMNAIHHKGYFKNEKFASFNCLKRCYLYLAFTCLGLLIMPFIDIIQKFEAVMGIILLPTKFLFPNSNFNLSFRFHRGIEYFHEQIFNLNAFELDTFEKQKKQTQLIFEDLIMILLDFLIYTHILKVPEIQKNKWKQSSILQMQLISTSASMLSALIALKIEALGLREQFLEYVMLSVKAKQDWVPFGDQIKNREIKQDIDYSLITFKIPARITDCVGSYMALQYQFTEQSLKKLSTQLLVAHTLRTEQNDSAQKQLISQSLFGSELDRQCQVQMVQSADMETQFQSPIKNQKRDIMKNFIPNLKFGFSLNPITAHTFLTFIDQNYCRDPNFVYNKLDLNDIDWKQLIINSMTHDLDLITPVTDGGKPLLQVCIDNENSALDGMWQLKDMMQALLNYTDEKHQKINVNVLDYSEKINLLTYCYQHQKHRAFDMIINHSEDLDPNITNTDGTTIFGRLFYESNLDYYNQKCDFQPQQKLQKLHLHFGNRIDMHKSQVNMNLDSICTPIFCYIKKNYDCRKVETMDELFGSEKFQQYFGIDNQQYQIQSCEEIHQLLGLAMSTVKHHQLLAKDIITQVCKKKSLDEMLQAQDKLYKNNVMHLTQGKFADKFWVTLIEDKSLETLKSIVRELLKQTNLRGQTPIQNMLKCSPPQPSINRLFEFDLIDLEIRDTFTGIEAEVINGIFQRAIDHYQSQSAKKAPYFIKEKEKFFKAFNNEIKYYKMLKQKFYIQDKSYIFEKYFMIDEYEQLMKNNLYTSCGYMHEERKDIALQFKQLLEKKPFDENAQVIDLNTAHDLRAPSTVIIKDISQQDVRKKNEQQQRRKYFLLETLLNTLIEISSVADFISDFWILAQLQQSIHTAWFSFAFFTMLCPYYTVYTSLMTFQINDTRDKIERNKLNMCQQLIKLSMILPTMLAQLIIFDIIYMMYSAVTLPILLVLAFIPYFGKVVNKFYEDYMNNFFMRFFGMSMMDFKGFRCQRTILQLQLESIPQIFFQIYLLFRIQQLSSQSNSGEKVDSGLSEQIGISPSAIELSLLSALIHVIFEMINLYLEARTSQTSFKDYMVACYNARQGWIPQQKDFSANQMKDKVVDDLSCSIIQSELERHIKAQFIGRRDLIQGCESVDENSLHCCQQNLNELNAQSKVDNFDQLRMKKMLIRFDDKDRKFCKSTCNIGFSICFELSDNSMEYLFQIVSNMPVIEDADKHKRKTLYLGTCLKPVNIRKIIHLSNLAYQKINLEFDEQILKDIMKSDERFITQIQKPNSSSKSHNEEHILIEMVQKSYSQIFKIMIELDAEINVRSKKPIKIKHKHIEKGASAFKIAYINGNHDILALMLLNMKKPGVNVVIKNAMLKNEVIWNEVCGNKDRYLKSNLILLDTQMPVPWDFQNSCFYRMNQQIQSNCIAAKQRWNVLFGAYIPPSNISSEDDCTQVIDHIVQWVGEYPEKIKVCDSKSQLLLELDRQFFCQFIAIRRAFHLPKADPVNYNPRDGIIELDSLLRENMCSLYDLLNVYKIYHGRFDRAITAQELQGCDNIVMAMGLDKEQSVYLHESRQLLSIEEQEKSIVVVDENNEETFNHRLQANIIGVKSLKIYKVDPADTAAHINFQYEIQYCNGNVKSELPECKQVDPNVSEQLVFECRYENDDYSAVADFYYKKIHEIIKNTVQCNTQITMEILNKEGVKVPCRYVLELYKNMGVRGDITVGQSSVFEEMEC